MAEYRRNRARIERELKGVPQSEIEKTIAWQMAVAEDVWMETFVRPLLRMTKKLRRLNLG